MTTTDDHLALLDRLAKADGLLAIADDHAEKLRVEYNELQSRIAALEAENAALKAREELISMDMACLRADAIELRANQKTPGAVESCEMCPRTSSRWEFCDDDDCCIRAARSAT